MKSDIQCEILWNKLSLSEWQNHFASIRHSNILQDYNYALASAKTHHQSARWGLIKIGGKEAGLVQLMEVRILWGVFHAVILDRGPLWFNGFGGAAHIKAFFDEFNRQFPRRAGRKRRIIPEVADGLAASNILKQSGLNKKEDQSGYQSLWWDITQDEEEALANLKKNWRNKINKSKRADLTIEWDYDLKFYNWLKTHYILDKAARGYNGISPKLLDHLAAIKPSSSIMIGKAEYKGEGIAGILILKHGSSATYQIGWSSDIGREHCAHHALLWQARTELKKQGIKELDLGGVNDEKAAEGLKIFKFGTGATPYKLVGQYD